MRVHATNSNGSNLLAWQKARSGGGFQQYHPHTTHHPHHHHQHAAHSYAHHHHHHPNHHAVAAAAAAAVAAHTHPFNASNYGDYINHHHHSHYPHHPQAAHHHHHHGIGEYATTPGSQNYSGYYLCAALNKTPKLERFYWKGTRRRKRQRSTFPQLACIWLS